MKLKLFLGALAVSAGLTGQSFGFELLDRMLGLNNYGGSCCAPSCCEQTCAPEPVCCEAPAPKCCEPEPVCCEAAPTCCKKRRCHDLFGGLKGLFDCNRCNTGCCEAAPTCCEAPAPACCEAPAPSCCESAPVCCKKRRHHGLLHHLFAHRGFKKSCCVSTCDTGCDSGCSSCNGGSAHAGDYQPSAPTPAAEGDDAPAPPAPMADPSASYRSQNRVFQASKYVRTR